MDTTSTCRNNRQNDDIEMQPLQPDGENCQLNDQPEEQNPAPPPSTEQNRVSFVIMDGKRISKEEMERLKGNLKGHELAISIIGGRSQQYNRDQCHRLAKVAESTNTFFIVPSSSSHLEKAFIKEFNRICFLRCEKSLKNECANNGLERSRTTSQIENVADLETTSYSILDNNEEGASDENESRKQFEHYLIDEKKFALITILMSGANDEKERIMQVERLHECVVDDKPVIVIKGSGNIAKLVEKLKSKMEEFDVIAKKEIRSHISGRIDNERVESLKKTLRLICESDKVELVDSNDSTRIYYVILQHLRSKLLNERIFNLAVEWDNIDTAAEILEDFEIEEQNKIETLITKDKVKFVKLLIDAGVDIKEILTRRMLETMYHETETLVSSEFKWLERKLRPKGNERVQLKDVSRVLEELTQYGDKYSGDGKESETFDDPFHELMIYSIFYCRLDMANYFWKQTERPLLNALIAVFMAHKFKKQFFKRFNETMVESYLQIERTFEYHAIEVINRAHQHDPSQTSELLESESDPYWPKLRLIEVAVAANAKYFLGTNACQSEIFRRWNRGYECNRTKYLLAFFIPPLIFSKYFVRFDEENAAAKWHTKDPTIYDKMNKSPQNSTRLNQQYSARITHESSRQQQFGCFKKLRTFYTSACSKFTIHSIAYILYLLLFSYVVLFRYKRDNISYWECFLYICQLLICMELFYNMYLWTTTRFKSRLISWLTSGSFATWHNLDCFHMFIVIISIVCRILSYLNVPYVFPLGRLALLCALTILYLRLFKIIFITSYFGPKVVAIAKMSRELGMFFMFFLVFMLAYSICSQALIDVNMVLSLRSIGNLLLHGLWKIFGELTEGQDVAAILGCPENVIDAGLFSTEDTFDCFTRQLVAPILLALYLFIASVLLMNMLIAVFTHIFEEINESTIQVWRYQMYFLVKEYDNRSILPVPIILLHHVYLCFRDVFHNKKQPNCGQSEQKASRGEKQEAKVSDNELKKRLESCKDLEAICQAQYLENIHSPSNLNLTIVLGSHDRARISRSCSNLTIVLGS